MALYKKNGYSMFGSCLPMILSIVIFIFAINGFQDYSRYQNRQYFYEMACAYNNVIYSGLEVDGEFVTLNDSDEIVVDGQKVLIQLQDLPAGETKTFASKKNTTKAIKKLKKGTYQVQVRAFVQSGKQKAYSTWSKTQKVKVK